MRTVPPRTYLADYDDEVRGRPYPGGMVLARHRAFKEAASSDTSLQSLGRFAADLLGYPYDKDEIAKIAARIVAGFLPFSRAEKRALKHDREYICSEYVFECYKDPGHRDRARPSGFRRAGGLRPGERGRSGRGPEEEVVEDLLVPSAATRLPSGAWRRGPRRTAWPPPRRHGLNGRPSPHSIGKPTFRAPESVQVGNGLLPLRSTRRGAPGRYAIADQRQERWGWKAMP